MPYIGNPIYQAAFVTDQFSGDGTTTAFTMSVAPAGTSNVLVVVSGVVQDPSTYGVVGTTLTFTGAPPSGSGNISCRYLGVPATGVTTTAYRTVTEFTATAAQTTFTPPSYDVGFINVYRNGVLLGSADYTATNGTTVVLATGATAGDLVTVESFLISSVANAISNTAGSVNSNNIADGAVGTAELADAGVTAAKLASGAALSNLGTAQLADANMPAGSVLQVVSATKTDTSSFTSSTFADVTGLSVSITPLSTTSKILVIVNVNSSWQSGVAKIGGRLMRDSTAIAVGDAAGSRTPVTGFAYWNITADVTVPLSMTYLDSPSTTSATTYKWQANNMDGAGTVYINRSYVDTNSAIFGRTPSTITVMEIAG